MIKPLMMSCNTLPNIDTEIRYPCLASGKLDGIRGCVQNGVLSSRSGKDSLNRHATQYLSKPIFEGLDGELCLKGEKWNVFLANQSAFMEQSGKPEFIFHVFDDINQPYASAAKRKALTSVRVQKLFELGYDVHFCEQHLVNSPAELRDLYDEYRSRGYEGLIVTDPKGLYKHGRSTLKQGISLKLKPCQDDEGVIVDFEEYMFNLDAGNSKRKENLIPGDKLGAFILEWRGVRFGCGTGLTDAQRKLYWKNRDSMLGAQVTFKYMETFPDTGAPRSPVFKAIRVPQ